MPSLALLLSYLINLFSGHTYIPGSTNIKKDDSKHIIIFNDEN